MYTSYFGFREKPFDVTPNPQFFYSNQGYEEAYANLLYGIRERKGFLLLTGEVGTGKTTILQRLMEELESTVRFVFFYNTNLTFDELLTFICDELGLTVQGNSQLDKIRALNDFLLDRLRNGSTVVLFIDEAQNLGEEVFENLRLLSNLETPREKLLQIVLAGQPELEAKLDRPQLRQIKQRIFFQSRLSSLSEEEVAAFIDHRLKIAGSRLSELFQRDAVREIALYSKGIPRLVNIICDNALIIAYADSQKKVTADIIGEVARDLRLAYKDQAARVRPAPVRPLSYIRKPDSGRRPTVLQDETAGSHADANLAEEIEPGIRRAPKAAPPPAQPVTISMPQLLESLTRALTEAMGPMAPFVVRDYLNGLGDSSEALPKARFEKLVHLVSPEILDRALRAGFQEKMFALADRLSEPDRNWQAR